MPRAGAQARAVDPVDAEGGGRFGDVGLDRGLPGGVLTSTGHQHLGPG